MFAFCENLKGSMVRISTLNRFNSTFRIASQMFAMWRTSPGIKGQPRCSCMITKSYWDRAVSNNLQVNSFIRSLPIRTDKLIFHTWQNSTKPSKNIYMFTLSAQSLKCKRRSSKKMRGHDKRLAFRLSSRLVTVYSGGQSDLGLAKSASLLFLWKRKWSLSTLIRLL